MSLVHVRQLQLIGVPSSVRCCGIRCVRELCLSMNSFTVFGQTFTFTNTIDESFRVHHPSFPGGRKDFKRGHTKTLEGIDCWNNAASMVLKVEKALADAEVSASMNSPDTTVLTACACLRSKSVVVQLLQWPLWQAGLHRCRDLDVSATPLRPAHRESFPRRLRLGSRRLSELLGIGS